MNIRSVLIISCLILVFSTGCQTASVKSATQPARQLRLVDFGHDICLDTVNGLMWQVEKSGALASWQQAHQYAENLDSAGFNDWRLPTYDELYILNKIFDRKKYGNCQIKLKGSFWTGNTEKKARAGFWDNDSLCAGPSYFFIKRSMGAVIAVRMSEVTP